MCGTAAQYKTLEAISSRNAAVSADSYSQQVGTTGGTPTSISGKTAMYQRHKMQRCALLGRLHVGASNFSDMTDVGEHIL